jgi:PBSX family phage terminase large subunit
MEKFSKKQMQVLNWWCKNSPFKTHDAIICDGTIRSGKTFCMSLSFLLWAFKKFNNASFGLCGKTIISLKRNVLTPILHILNEIGFFCNLKISENTLEIAFNGKKNRFYLFSGKDESSASLIQGITLSGILFDEVALMPQSFVKQALARCSVADSKFWFNCNPEYPQHWFYQEWILGKTKKNALYLHFTMQDNPSLSDSIIKRYKNLYSGTFYERFIKGKWTSIEGAIYPFMSNANSFPDVPNLPFECYRASCDYGTVNPCSFGLWAKHQNTWYRIREYYYDSRKELNQRTDEEHYKALCELIDNLPVDVITVDPSAASFITVIQRHGKYQVIPANNKVIDGIRQVSTALKDEKIKICNTCKDSIREFSLYRWDTTSCNDSPVKDNDHTMDDIRYFVTSILNNSLDSFFALSVNRP